MNREFAIPAIAFILHMFEKDTGLKALNGYLIRKILQPCAATTFLGVERSQWRRPTAVVARYPSETAG